jgi:hypothetical protein
MEATKHCNHQPAQHNQFFSFCLICGSLIYNQVGLTHKLGPYYQTSQIQSLF